MFRRRRGSEVAMFNRRIIKKIDWRWAPLPVIPNINLNLFYERFVYDVLLVPFKWFITTTRKLEIANCFVSMPSILFAFFSASASFILAHSFSVIFLHFSQQVSSIWYPHTALRLHPGFVWPIDSVCRHTEQGIRTRGFYPLELHFVGMPTNSLRGTPCSELQTWSYGAVYW